MVGYRNPQARARAAFVAAGGNTPSPGIGRKLFASNDNYGYSLTVDSAGLAGYYVADQHTFRGAWSTFEISVANFRIDPGSTGADAATSARTIKQLIAIYNGQEVALTFDAGVPLSATPKVLASGQGPTWTVAVTPAMFGASTFANGSTIIFKEVGELPAGGGTLPRPNGYTGLVAGGQLRAGFFDPAATTVTASGQTGLNFGSTGTAPVASSFAPYHWLRGTPVNPAQESVEYWGDSFVDGPATGYWLGVKDAGLPGINYGVSASKSSMGLTSSAAQSLHANATILNIQFGTNDLPLGSPQGIMNNVMTRVEQARSAGVIRFYVGELLMRTTSANGFVAPQDQVAASGFEAGGPPEQFNALARTYVGSGVGKITGVIATRAPLQDATNTALWSVADNPPLPDDGKHPRGARAVVIIRGVVSVTLTGPVTPSVTLSAAQSKAEGASGATAFTYTVTRSNSTGAVSVPWAFAAGSTSADDFVGSTYPAGGMVALADGVSSGSFTVNVQGDATVEPDEAFTVSITAPSGYAGGASMSATGTILNDDSSGGSSYTFTNGEASAFVARFAVPPTDTYRAAIDNFIGALKTSGSWDVRDAIYLPLKAPAEQAALLNLKGANYSLAKNGTIAFDAAVGFTGDGTTGYLGTGFNPATAGGNLTQDSASLTALAGNEVSEAVAIMGTALTTGAMLKMNPRNTANQVQLALNSATIANTSATATASSGIVTSVWRSAASTTAARRTKTAVSPTASTSSGVPSSELLLLRDGAAYSTRSLQFAAYGGAITTAMHDALVDAISAYKAALA